jgi:hypothetical protein
MAPATRGLFVLSGPYKACFVKGREKQKERSAIQYFIFWLPPLGITAGNPTLSAKKKFIVWPLRRGGEAFCFERTVPSLLCKRILR